MKKILILMLALMSAGLMFGQQKVALHNPFAEYFACLSFFYFLCGFNQ
ncbi:MAG: hypothetical protein LBL04_10730 [Bacteroidales bacterium]|jgi:hypothetical protein|nr:hypothetical protein [Bacteroidales bacterium]